MRRDSHPEPEEKSHAVHRDRRLAADKPVVTGVVTGGHEVYGSDEKTFPEGVGATVVTAP